MSPRRTRVVLLMGSAWIVLAPPSTANAQPQEDVKLLNIEELDEKIDAAVMELAREIESEDSVRAMVQATAARGASPQEQTVAVDSLSRVVLDGRPRTRPSSKQVSAPSQVSGSTSLVNAPSFPEFIGLAFDNNLVALTEGSTTFNVNLFSFLALSNPDVLDRQTLYDRYDWVRRVGGSVSLGGKGDALDRDGDGKTDEPVTADNLWDIVTWEFRARVFGSRDRRDASNFARYMAVLRPLQDEYADRHRRFLLDHMSRFLEMTVTRGGEEGFSEDEVDAFLATPEIQEELRRIALAYAGLTSRLERINERIDRSAVWSVVVNGTRKANETFGPNRLGAALRGLWAWGPVDNNFNLDWTEIEGLGGAPDGERWKLGYEASWLWLEGSALTERGIATALAAAWERFENIPSAKHENIAKATLRFEFPISDSVSVPLSFTYANHKDLLTDEDEVLGNIGISVDLSKLRKN